MFKIFLALSFIFVLIGNVSAGVGLSWQDNSDNEDGFRVERAPSQTGVFAQVGIVGPNVTSFNDTAGVGGNCYRIIAFNVWGVSAPTNVACAGMPPNGATGLTLEPL